MTVELRFFATFRSAVGQKTVERDYGAETVGELLAAVEDEWPELTDELLRDGEIPGQVSVLRNGKDVHHLDGPATPVEGGDRVSVFPPVAGGGREKSYRGISKRLAAQYLENLGGERVDEDRVEGDGWTAELSAEKVRAAGSMELTEVTVVFEGKEAELDPLIEAFSRKAMRAGG